MSKAYGVCWGPSFQAGCSNRQFLFSQHPAQSLTRVSHGFRDSLLYHIDHPKNASSHVVLQDNISTSITTRRFWSSSYLLSIMYGEHTVQFRFLTSDHFLGKYVVYVSRFANTQNSLFLGRGSPREIGRREFHRGKGQYGVLWTPIQW